MAAPQNDIPRPRILILTPGPPTPEEVGTAYATWRQREWQRRQQERRIWPWVRRGLSLVVGLGLGWLLWWLL